MVSDILVFNDMKGLMVVLDMWDTSCAHWNLTYGYVRTDTYMNILTYMSTN